MQGLDIRPVKLALGSMRRPAWRPSVGQAVTTTPTTPPMAVAPAVPSKAPIIDSALVALVFDVLGATASGILAYGAASRKNKLAYLFGGMAAVMSFKAIADLNDIRTR